MHRLHNDVINQSIINTHKIYILVCLSYVKFYIFNIFCFHYKIKYKYFFFVSVCLYLSLSFFPILCV